MLFVSLAVDISGTGEKELLVENSRIVAVLVSRARGPATSVAMAGELPN